MKILVASPVLEDSFADNVQHTLREMGHEVLAPPAQSWTSYYGWRQRLARRAATRFSARAVDPVQRWTVGAARAFRPQLVLALTQELPESVLADLRRLGGPRLVAWWADTPANMGDPGLVAEGWDLVYLKDADAVRKLRILGLEARLLHEAMNPAWHRPFPGPKTAELVVAGNPYSYRRALVTRLARAGVSVALYGPPPSRRATAEVKAAFRGRFVVKDEKSRILAEGLACLNSMHIREGNSLNCRAFESAGAAALQIVEHRPALAECFDPGTEILSYANFDELLGHVDRARRDPAGSARIREAGHRRALRCHTYRHRLARILEDVFA